MTSRCALIYFNGTHTIIGLYQITSRFSRQSLILGTALGIGGLIAILPGALYIIRYNPEDAVIDVTFLLIYLFEPLAIIAFVVALIRRVYREKNKKNQAKIFIDFRPNVAFAGGGKPPRRVCSCGVLPIPLFPGVSVFSENQSSSAI